ncbi:MAG: type 4a pilus biogenesis protein PilO [Candidatus Pacebacteria bacterium]|nr:type 4a pilus biogenesis protein PilO [Candidatus Paceibacterota bacterium]
MNNSSKRITFILLSLAFLIASVFAYSLLVRGSYATIQGLRSDLASVQDKLEKYQSTNEKIKQLQAQFQNAGDVQQKVSLVIPRQKDVGYFTNQIVELARINGLSLQTINTAIVPIQQSVGATVIKPLGKIKADVTIVGSYASFKAFLNQIENNVLVMDITDLKVEGTTLANATTLTFTLSLISYYQVQ